MNSLPLNSIGLYIHIPWCIQKCPYCDFNSHAVKSGFPEQQYVQTLLNDLQANLELLDTPRTISSIFIGGGTPSLFSANTFEQLFEGIIKLIPLQNNIEITLEANPGTFESQKFADFRSAGINRLSIGIQSFNNQHLKTLGRIHSAEEALLAVEIAKESGFNNLNLDLMFGLPSQSNDEMLNDVQTAIDLNPSHISFYQLTLEPNTFFHKFPPRLPEDDLIFSGQTECQLKLDVTGYKQYEISAYAKNNQMCRHNLNYWGFGDYLGIGAGAHGKISQSKNIIRTAKHKSPEQYLNDFKPQITAIPQHEIPLEYLMNQLRLKAGFNLNHYQQLTATDKQSLEPALSECVAENLLVKHGQQYVCSEKGWHFIDSILEKFINQ